MRERGDSRLAATHLIQLLGDQLDFSDGDRSFSPFYSDIGLGVTEAGGIAALFLHYNRRMTTFLEPFLALPDPVEPHRKTALGIQQRFREGEAEIAFCDHNTFIVDCSGLSTLQFNPALQEDFAERRCRRVAAGIVLFDGYLPTADPRDADRTFPFVVGLRLVTGSIESATADAVEMVAAAGQRLVLLFSVRVLEVDHGQVLSRLENGSSSAQEAQERAQGWWAEVIGPYEFGSVGDGEAEVLARAVYTLIGNSAACPGLLQDRICGFPSRGTYPCAYLWDSCFQNLGTELFNPGLAEDSLMVFVDNLRSDGKIHAFICSTWAHPGQSQPPLLGWAGRRLVQQSGDARLAAQLLPALRRNTQWWLSQRMTRFGLVAAANGMEVGWDDTPRFESGPIVACDLNSYLLLQMRICAEFAGMCGDSQAAAELESQADAYADRMVSLLFDPDSGLFWDLSLDSGDPVRIKTPACFLPLLAEVPLDAEDKRRAIEGYLLNPSCFFGEVPFPVVAYDEPSYESDQWWRGPTWINVAYLMIDLLDAMEYRDQAQSARRRLYDLLIADGDLRELFDSQTGAGLGAHEYGWTAAICLRLYRELGQGP